MSTKGRELVRMVLGWILKGEKGKKHVQRHRAGVGMVEATRANNFVWLNAGRLRVVILESLGCHAKDFGH